jgi:hypothetical protein
LPYLTKAKNDMEKDFTNQVHMLVQLREYASAARLVATEIRKQLTEAQLAPIEPLEATLYKMVQEPDFDVNTAVNGLVYFAKKGIIHVRGR